LTGGVGGGWESGFRGSFIVMKRRPKSCLLTEGVEKIPQKQQKVPKGGCVGNRVIANWGKSVIFGAKGGVWGKERD